MIEEKKYRESHKWLTFDANLKGASPELWLMLGECQSKCDHLARYPLRPDIAAEIHKMYMAKGVLATTAIEGNTLSEEEVKKLLDGELELPPSREYLGQEVSNIIDECNRIVEAGTNRERLELNTERIKEINRAVLNKLKLPEHVTAGEIRTYDVGVGLYKGAPHEDCEHLLDELCKWLNNTDYFSTPDSPRAMVFAIIKAILAHLYLAWIHPFGDGNGRTARLIEFQILLASRVPSPAAHLLSNHYYHTRSEYYRQLHQASESGGDILPFITYAVQGFLDGLKAQLEVVKRQVLEVVWQNYIADQFLEKTKPADIRRRDLIEDLSRIKTPEAFTFEQLPLITPRVLNHYKNKTSRTLVRDLKELFDMRLIMFDKGLVRPRKEEILAFLPSRVPLPTDEEKPKRGRRSKTIKLVELPTAFVERESKPLLE
ncbi:MAG: Fic family protein [Acidobacteriota bacterium]|nr:Fic family protein [Acidobacteriota bacterium]